MEIDMLEPQKYRTNPEPAFVDAIQWTGDNLAVVLTFIEGKPPDMSTRDGVMRFQDYQESVAKRGLSFHQHYGVMPGNWIVRDVSGRLHVFIDAHFRETYVAAAAPVADRDLTACLNALRGMRHVLDQLDEALSKRRQ
jgi:hypothetical protein